MKFNIYYLLYITVVLSNYFIVALYIFTIVLNKYPASSFNPKFNKVIIKFIININDSTRLFITIENTTSDIVLSRDLLITPGIINTL